MQVTIFCCTFVEKLIMDNKLGRETAFPLDGEYYNVAKENNYVGLSKRLYLACEMAKSIDPPKVFCGENETDIL